MTTTATDVAEQIWYAVFPKYIFQTEVTGHNP